VTKGEFVVVNHGFLNPKGKNPRSKMQKGGGHIFHHVSMTKKKKKSVAAEKEKSFESPVTTIASDTPTRSLKREKSIEMVPKGKIHQQRIA